MRSISFPKVLWLEMVKVTPKVLGSRVLVLGMVVKKKYGPRRVGVWWEVPW